MIPPDVSLALKKYRSDGRCNFLGATTEEMTAEELLGMVGYLRAELRKVSWLNEQSRQVTQRFNRVTADP